MAIRNNYTPTGYVPTSTLSAPTGTADTTVSGNVTTSSAAPTGTSNVTTRKSTTYTAQAPRTSLAASTPNVTVDPYATPSVNETPNVTPNPATTPSVNETPGVSPSSNPTNSSDGTNINQNDNGDERFDKFGNYISFATAKPEIQQKYKDMAKQTIDDLKSKANTEMRKDRAKIINKIKDYDTPKVNQRYKREAEGASPVNLMFRIYCENNFSLVHKKDGSVYVESQNIEYHGVPTLEDVAEYLYDHMGNLGGY